MSNGHEAVGLSPEKNRLRYRYDILHLRYVHDEKQEVTDTFANYLHAHFPYKVNGFTLWPTTRLPWQQLHEVCIIESSPYLSNAHNMECSIIIIKLFVRDRERILQILTSGVVLLFWKMRIAFVIMSLATVTAVTLDH